MSKFIGLACALLAAAFAGSQAHGGAGLTGAQLSTSPEYYYARYRINGARPQEFADVAYLILGVRHSPRPVKREPAGVKYDEAGNALIEGEVWTEEGLSYEFKAAKLTRSATLRRDGCGLFTRLSVVTEGVGGVSYGFEGQFLERPEQAETGNFTKLRGMFTKFKDGEKVAESRVDFTRLGVE